MTTRSDIFLPKLAPPRRRSDTIRRERLHQLLASAFDYELVVISAPAGYGKSTLAVDWCADCGLPAAWLSLDHHDADPLTLVSDVVATLRVAFPGKLDEFAAQLETGAVPSQAAALTGQLVAAVHREIEDLFVLVLDDVHALAESPEALEVVDALVRGLPLSMRLYLLSRTWPDLSALPRMTAQRRAFSVSAQDLQFTDDEALEFLTRSGIPEAWSQIELLRRADGWAAALAILADHYDATRGPRRATSAGSEFVLADFIDQEVLGRLPQRQLALLRACAVPRSFDLELMQALSGEDDAALALRELENTNHLVSGLDGGWYRMHALLREHLLARLGRDEPQRLHQLRRSAAALLARRGQRREAVALSIEAEDWPEVVRELHDLREELYQRGEWSTLSAWLDRLPAEVLEDEPDLVMTRARMAIKLLHGQDGLARLDALDERGLSAEQRVRRQLYRAVALRQVSQLSAAIEACRRARALALESQPDDAAIFAEIDLEEAVALNISGQFAAAQERFHSAAEAFEQLADHHRAAEARDGMGIALFHQGWLADSMREFTSAQRRWRMLADPNAQIATMNNIGNVQHMLGELETARDTFTGVVHRAQDIQHRRYQAYGQQGLADVERDLGRLEVAEALYTLAIKEAQEIDDPVLVAHATYGLAMSQRERGQYRRARTLLDHGLRSAEQSGAVFLQMLFRGGIGATLLSQHQFQEAAPVLEQALAEAETLGALRECATLHLLLAYARFNRRRRTEAVDHLRRAHALVEELGYDQFLRAEARQMPELIEYGGAKHVGGEYYRTLRAQFRTPEEAAEEAAAAAAAGSPGLRAEAFGTPRVTLGSHQIADLEWPSERSKEMFFYLLHSQRPVRKEQIALELWPDASPKQLNSAFHSTLYRLRRAIDPQIVVQTDEGYHVNPSFEIAYDAQEFELHTRGAERAASGSQDWAEELAAAVRLYRGPFAETFDSAWADDARRRYEDRYLVCLLALAAHARQRGDYEEAVKLSESVLEIDPLNEEAVQHLMRAHARGGHLDLAARAYRRLHSAMEDELGQEPGEALQHVYEQVLSGAALDA